MRIQALLLSAFAFFPLHSALSETLLERGEYLERVCRTDAQGATSSEIASGRLSLNPHFQPSVCTRSRVPRY